MPCSELPQMTNAPCQRCCCWWAVVQCMESKSYEF